MVIGERRFEIAHLPGKLRLALAKGDRSRKVLTIPAEISTFSSKVTLKEVRVRIGFGEGQTAEMEGRYIATNDSFLSGFFTKTLPWSLGDNECQRVWMKGLLPVEIADHLGSTPEGIEVEIIARDHTAVEARSGVTKRRFV